MYEAQTPKWLRLLERHLGWLAVPNIAILLVTLQALGFLFVMSNPLWLERLALVPERVLEGEVWRLFTFLALPISMSPIFIIFVLWFLYFVVNTIEREWGAFRTTFYVLISIIVTIAFSFATGYPVTHVGHFESTLFLAAAALMPEFTIYLFLAVPVKMKWLAWVTLAFVGWEFARGYWLDRLFLIAIYSNYLIFFGPAVLNRIKQAGRRKKFQNKMR